MYVYRCCWYTSHSSHHVCIKVLYFYLQLALVKVLQPVERHDFVEAFQERLGLFLDAAVEPPLGDEPAVTKQSKAIQQQQNHLETNKDWLFVHWVTSLQLQTKAIQHEKITSWKRILNSTICKLELTVNFSTCCFTFPTPSLERRLPITPDIQVRNYWLRPVRKPGTLDRSCFASPEFETWNNRLTLSIPRSKSTFSQPS